MEATFVYEVYVCDQKLIELHWQHAVSIVHKRLCYRGL